MIVLKNELFTCQPCLLVNKSQRCFHLKEKYLISVKSSSHVQVKDSETSTTKDLSGSYRFRIDCSKKKPVIKRKISPQDHQNDEILFHKDLKVDTNSSIGPVIYILDEKTPIELERFILTSELGKPIPKLVHKNFMIVDFTINGTKSNNQSIHGYDCVLIRPIEKPNKPVASIASCSKSPVKLPLYFDKSAISHVDDPLKVPSTFEIHAANQSSSSSGSDESVKTIDNKIGEKWSMKLIGPKMDEFLKNTEEFLNDFLKESAISNKDESRVSIY